MFNVGLATVHSFAWIGWSASFYIPSLSGIWPRPYPPLEPTKYRSVNAATPAILVGLTTLAMSFELLDFAPLLRMLDAHALWHLCTIPLGMAWWHFLAADAIELEGTMMQSRGVSAAGVSAASGGSEKMPLSGGLFPNSTGSDSTSDPSGQSQAQSQGQAIGSTSGTDVQSPALPQTPSMPNYAKLAAGIGLARNRSPGRSPGRNAPTSGKERED